MTRKQCSHNCANGKSELNASSTWRKTLVTLHDTRTSEEEKNEAEKAEKSEEPNKEKKRRDDVEHSDDESSAEMQEADANVEDCATLVEAREYYDFVKERAARCDEYAKFMLGDLKRDNESIEELAGKLKRARPTWYSPKYADE